MTDIKSTITKELSCSLCNNSYIMPNYLEKPISLGNSFIERILKRHSLIKEFLKTVSFIAQDAIKTNNKDILKILFSESPAGMSIQYHKELPECCWNIPILYRTDESLSGKIYEIQSPGSGWGDLYLLSNCYKKLGYSIPDYLSTFPDLYADNIAMKTGIDNPKVFHMLDAASVPYSMKYLMSITKRIRYWGISDQVTSMDDINCLISHSVISIVTANFFKSYLSKSNEGKFLFAIPPNLIFDEKAIYLLPFYRETRSYFSNEIRAIFPFTTFIENGGFYDENQDFIDVNSFSMQKPKKPYYYLKYGGPDTNQNWGSRSVFRLDGKKSCKELLETADLKSKKGEIWLIQKDVSEENPNMQITEDINDLLSHNLYIKLSSYYGDKQLMGIKVMARHEFKVHGQNNTYVSIGI